MDYHPALTETSRRAGETWRPPPDIDISDWADKHYRLSDENSSTPGRWTTFAYQREPMNLQKDPTVRRITVKKSSRVGFTKACINIPLGYFMHHDPRSGVVLLPTETSAETYSKDELTPMLRDCEVLRGLVTDAYKSSTNTILKKRGPGFVLNIGGAESARVFRQLTASIAWCDETAAYSNNSGGEGYWLKLITQRMADAWNRLLVEGSSPKLKGACAITDSYEQSDMRRYLVPCPHCDHGQFLEWGGKELDFGIKWDPGQPETAYYLCENCHLRIEHHQKRQMVDQGYYIPTNPNGGWPGFHIWAAYSYLPNAAWPMLVQEFLDCGTNPSKLQVFENTIKGEAFEFTGEAPSERKLMARRERYPQRKTGRTNERDEPETESMVPKPAVFLTAGTDVHPDRIETQVLGWGAGEELWPVAYFVLHGDPTAEPVWDEWFEWLRRPWWIERGGVDFVRSTCVDSGYATQSVYKFVSPRTQYRLLDGRIGYLWAIKGQPGSGAFWPRSPTKPDKKTKIPLYNIKVDAGKEVLYARLEKIHEKGPGYIHFPLEFDEDYFRQLTSEHRRPKENRRGYVEHEWALKAGRSRNEVLDTMNYGYAALCGAYQMGLDLEALAKKPRAMIPHPEPAGDPFGDHVDATTAPPTSPPADPSRPRQRRKRRRSRSNYLG